MTGGRLRHYGARRSDRGGRDRMVLVALPKMTEGTPPDPLARLGERLAKAEEGRARQLPGRPGGTNLQQGLSLGLRIGVELVVAVVVGTGLGWAIDWGLGTQPWGTLVLFFRWSGSAERGRGGRGAGGQRMGQGRELSWR